MQVASKTLRTSAALMGVSMNPISSLHPFASIIFNLFEETAYFILLVIDRFRWCICWISLAPATIVPQDLPQIKSSRLLILRTFVWKQDCKLFESDNAAVSASAEQTWDPTFPRDQYPMVPQCISMLSEFYWVLPFGTRKAVHMRVLPEVGLGVIVVRVVSHCCITCRISPVASQPVVETWAVEEGD